MAFAKLLAAVAHQLYALLALLTSVFGVVINAARCRPVAAVCVACSLISMVVPDFLAVVVMYGMFFWVSLIHVCVACFPFTSRSVVIASF